MSTQSMSFTLIKNPFSEEDYYIARVVNQKSISFEALLLEMENNTAIRKQDFRLAVTQLKTAITANLLKGVKVVTPIGEFRPTIRGKFNSLDEDFRPSASTNNHQIRFTINPDSEMLNEVMEKTVTEKISDYTIKHPHIISISNNSKPADEGFHSTNVIIMNGLNLKFNPENDDEGIFWINNAGESFKTTSFSTNTNTAIHFQIPELVPGEYSVTVATRLGNHKIRETQLDDPIVIS